MRSSFYSAGNNNRGVVLNPYDHVIFAINEITIKLSYLHDAELRDLARVLISPLAELLSAQSHVALRRPLVAAMVIDRVRDKVLSIDESADARVQKRALREAIAILSELQGQTGFNLTWASDAHR
jgi:hypothetical protein